jgi:predicted MPP superfamily phosphohydrolase
MYQNPAFGQGPAPASSSSTSTAPEERLVIHHLSDLHRGRTAGGRHALANYTHRLYHLPPEQQPDYIIVTGDLTLAGSPDELHEVAADIHNMTLKWDELTRRQRVFIIPGPHDIDWNATYDRAASLDAFAREFYGFCLPALPTRDGKLISTAEPYVHSTNHHILVYLVNTCYVPEALPQLPQPMAKQLEELLKKYRATWKEHSKTPSRPVTGNDEEARRIFLKNTEELLALDTGMVRAADVNHLAQVMQNLPAEDGAFALSSPGEEAPVPLKIVVTHHPLVAFTGTTGRMYPAAQDAGTLLRTMRRFGFHLALHGHTHEAHVLSDMPIESANLGGDTPLVQIGAGSLGGVPGDAPTFNEMVAIRHRASGRWTLQLTPLNPTVETVRHPYSFNLSNLSTDPAKTRTALSTDQVATMRQKFEARLSVALRLLAEEIDSEMTPDIPVRPLDTIKDLIKEVVFAGVETRIGLALKTRQYDNTIVLANHYIVPDVQIDEQYFHPFPYPDTIAALALIQGDTLIYPTQVTDPAATINYDTLRRNGKYDMVQRLLSEAAARNPGNARLAMLRNTFDAGTLKLSDMFQPYPTGVKPTRFASFIAVPIPLRPAPAFNTRPREIGTLMVDIVDADATQPGAAFTEERVDMLRTLAYFIDVILTTADKFRRPRGSWNF